MFKVKGIVKIDQLGAMMQCRDQSSVELVGGAEWGWAEDVKWVRDEGLVALHVSLCGEGRFPEAVYEGCLTHCAHNQSCSFCLTLPA